MGKKRDERLNELIVDTLRSAILSDPTFVQSIFQYTSDNAFVHPRSIPDLQTVNSLVGTAVISQEFTEADLVADGFGGWQLPFTFPDDNIPFAIRIDYDYTSGGGTTGVKNLNVNAENDIIFGFEDPANGTQNIRVFSTGIGVPPTPPSNPPIFTLQPPTNATVVQQNTLTIQIIATGATSYQWRKNGVDIVGQTTDTLTVSFFGSGDAGTYTCMATNIDGSTISSGCVVAYDPGFIISNRSNLKSDFTPNGSGVIVTVNDGVATKAIAIGSFDFFATAATSITVTQPGTDDLTVIDGVNTFTDALGGDVPNVYSKPIGGWLTTRLFNNN